MIEQEFFIIFSDPFQLQQAADIIQKLYLIALELPHGEKFNSARNKIAEKYNHVEKELIEEFRTAHHDGDVKKMKKVASVLSNFKGYGQCIEAFIEMSMKGHFMRAEPFDEVVPLIRNADSIVQNVFKSPETVLAKFVHTIYHNIIQNHAKKCLDSKEDPEEYLVTLNQLYTRTMKMSEELSEFKMGSDNLYLTKLSKTIFLPHLEAYINFETKYLNERCTAHLQRYYEGKEHQKKVMQSGGISELRRDLQAKLGTMTKANINIGPAIEDYGGETFLSQEVTISLLQEAKCAFKRCQMLSSSSQMSGNAVQVFEVLVDYLVVQHIDYALELGLKSIPLPDPNSQPVVYFFDVVGQANTLFHLFEKQFMDSLVPLVMSTLKHSQCLQRKRELRDKLESNIDTGLDKSIAAITGWVKNILSAEQKKTDFKPEDDSALAQMVSPACSKVTKFMSTISVSIHNSLDGKNVDIVLAELGIRFHRVIYEHLINFQYNSLGAMLVICDVNEYRRCVKEFKIELVTELFEKLHALCNLLVVVPENIKPVSSEDQLAGVDKSVLLSFLQLRTDFKSARLATALK